jgi:hypothetical protein
MTESGVNQPGGYHVGFSLLFSVVVLMAVYFRLYFGVNFTDEAYYIAIPYRFVTGSLPFQDDSTTLFSMFSFLSYPFYKLFHFVSSSTDALVIFARHCYLLCAVCAGLLVFMFARRLVSKPEALLVAVLMIAFVPGNIHSLSYNTCTILLFPLSLLFSAFGVMDNRAMYTGTAGMLMALVVMAYPPMLIPSVAAVALCLWYVKSDRLKFFGIYCLGISVVVLIMLPFLQHASLESLRENWEYIQTVGSQGGGGGKLWHTCRVGFADTYRGIMVGVAGVLLILKYRSNYPKLLLVLPFLPVLMAMMNRYPAFVSTAGHGFALSLALVCPFLVTRVRPEHRRLCVMIWIPAVIAGLVTGYSSNNGFVNLIIGFFPGVIISSIFVLLALRNGEKESALSVRVRIAFLASVLCVFMYYHYATVYGDQALRDLTQQVTTGPYKYLLTTPVKANFAEQITRDVRAAAVDNDIQSAVFYFNFPAGYLLTSLRPAINTVWLFHPKTLNSLSNRLLERRYRESGAWPDILVKMRVFINPDDSMSMVEPMLDHPLESLLNNGAYFPLISRNEYDIYRRSL